MDTSLFGNKFLKIKHIIFFNDKYVVDNVLVVLIIDWLLIMCS